MYDWTVVDLLMFMSFENHTWNIIIRASTNAAIIRTLGLMLHLEGIVCPLLEYYYYVSHSCRYSLKKYSALLLDSLSLEFEETNIFKYWSVVPTTWYVNLTKYIGNNCQTNVFTWLLGSPCKKFYAFKKLNIEDALLPYFQS